MITTNRIFSLKHLHIHQQRGGAAAALQSLWKTLNPHRSFALHLFIGARATPQRE